MTVVTGYSAASHIISHEQQKIANVGTKSCVSDLFYLFTTGNLDIIPTILEKERGQII